MMIKRSIVLTSLAILVGLSLTFSQVLAAVPDLPAGKKTPATVPPGIQQPNNNEEKKETKEAEKEAKKETQAAKQAEKSNKPEDSKTPKVSHTPDPSKAGKMTKGKHANFRGTVTTVTEYSLVVTLKNGDVVTILIDENTVVHVPSQGKSAGQAIAVGSEVSVHTVTPPGAEHPQAVAVNVIPAKPEHIHRVGTVTAYMPGVSITITAKDGSTTTFDISQAKFIANTAADIVVGESQVTIVSPRDVAGGELYAQAVVVRSPKKK